MFSLPAEVATPSVSTAPPSRWAAGFQAFLVCGLPTQFLIAGALIVMGFWPFTGGRGLSGDLSLEFFAILSLADTALVAVLIRLFLGASGEHSHDVFFGSRSIKREALLGLALLPVIFAGVVGIVVGLRAVAPWLHNVQQSPLEAFMRTPFESAIFAVVVVLAGGVREELQRAFIIHRFGQRLGGQYLGLAVFTLIFAVGHYDQGWDVSLAIGALGAFWGWLYIRRRSLVSSMVSHAGFNAAQVLQLVVARSMGL